MTTTPDRVHGGTPGWRERLADDLLLAESRGDGDTVITSAAAVRAALAASSPQEGGGGLAAPRNWSHSLNDGAMVVDPLPPAGVQVDQPSLERAIETFFADHGAVVCVPCQTPMRQLGADPLHFCCPRCGVTALLADLPAEGEADEAAGRVAGWLAVAQERSLRDRLTDADDVISSFAHREPRPRQPEFLDLVTDAVLLRSDLQSLRADRERLTRERDEARDLAFRAAFALEEGAVVEFAGVMPNGQLVYEGAHEEAVRDLTPPDWPIVCRVRGPWKPAPAPESSGGEPK